MSSFTVGGMLLAACVAAICACRPAPASSTAGSPAAGDAPTPAPASQRQAPRPRVIISSPSGRNTSIDVEIARTPEEQARGLMFREKLAPGTGMLFLFSGESDHVFWMKNTLIPLDMLFIDTGGTVVGLLEQVEPLTTSGRSVGVPSRYVLEVPGGYAAERGLRRGDIVHFEGI